LLKEGGYAIFEPKNHTLKKDFSQCVDSTLCDCAVSMASRDRPPPIGPIRFLFSHAGNGYSFPSTIR
jgi:hypothetical protein